MMRRFRVRRGDGGGAWGEGGLGVGDVGTSGTPRRLPNPAPIADAGSLRRRYRQ